jgi:IclR family pca regulon transcriptional regulator
MNRTDFISSLGKGLRVLEAFGSEHPRRTIAEVAASASLDRATARRCLLTLSKLGYAHYDGKFFTLTPRVLRLGVGALAALPLARLVQPWLDQLSDQLGQSTSVAILDDTEIVYVARAAQRKVMSIGLMPGSRLPAHCSSLGRVLLAALPENETRAIVMRSNLAPRTPFSLIDPEEIIERIRAARVDGYAVIDQEVEMGLRSIAVPLYSARGQIVGALNSGVSAAQATTEELMASYRPALLKVQAALRSLLG